MSHFLFLSRSGALGTEPTPPDDGPGGTGPSPRPPPRRHGRGRVKRISAHGPRLPPPAGPGAPAVPDSWSSHPAGQPLPHPWDAEGAAGTAAAPRSGGRGPAKVKRQRERGRGRDMAGAPVAGEPGDAAGEGGRERGCRRGGGGGGGRASPGPGAGTPPAPLRSARPVPGLGAAAAALRRPESPRAAGKPPGRGTGGGADGVEGPMGWRSRRRGVPATRGQSWAGGEAEGAWLRAARPTRETPGGDAGRRVDCGVHGAGWESAPWKHPAGLTLCVEARLPHRCAVALHGGKTLAGQTPVLAGGPPVSGDPFTAFQGHHVPCSAAYEVGQETRQWQVGGSFPPPNPAHCMAPGRKIRRKGDSEKLLLWDKAGCSSGEALGSGAHDLSYFSYPCHV